MVSWLLASLFLAQTTVLDHDAVGRLMRDSKTVEGANFAAVVHAATGQRVIPIDREADADWLAKVGAAVDETVEALNNPSHSVHKAGRINEASRFIEEALLDKLSQVPGWKCTIPKTSAGNEQRSGYPDLRLALGDGSIVYLDPKLYAEDSRNSSFRTFYYEPKGDTNKITDNAHHLLVGVAHGPGPDGRTVFRRWDLVDIATMPVRLKLEFQSSNREIYRDAATVLSGPATP